MRHLRHRPSRASSLVVIASLATAGLLLALKPAAWLANTWVDPTYDSFGGFAYVAVVGLALWSALSPRIVPEGNAGWRAAAWFAAASCVRLAGRLAGVTVVGAAALALDVYAAGVAAGLGERRRAVSPVWLAGLFCFSLPLERLLTRTVGFSLQRAAAAGACAVVQGAFSRVECLGTRALVDGRDVLVDLPAAGTQALLGLLFLYVAVLAVTRPRKIGAAVGLVVTIGAAVGANIARLAALAVGLARPDWVNGVNVMGQPWHDVIGLGAVVLGAGPVVGWGVWVWGARFIPAAISTSKRDEILVGTSAYRATLAKPSWVGQALAALAERRLTAHVALAALLVTIIVVTQPERPSDRLLNHMPILPEALGGTAQVPVPLSIREFAAFGRFGGGAARGRYGDQTLLVVDSAAPLRQLLAPDERLPAAGYTVELTGVEYGRLPAAVYHAVAPDGRIYRVAVTYVSEDGVVATSPAEVGWRWLADGGRGRWTALERTSYWDEARADRDRFDEDLARAFAVPRQDSQLITLTEELR